MESIDSSTLTGLRDRALIGTMVYTFARITAVVQMNVRDYFTQGRRGWVRLQAKGGKELEAACNHKLETYLDGSMRGTGLTAYFGNGGTLEKAQSMANHSSPRTTKLYNRTSDAVSREKYKKVGT